MNEVLANPRVGYVGFDCTADSLHVGNLTSLMLLRLFQKHGHYPIVLLGTSTSRVGDPSGKDEARVLLSAHQVFNNKHGIVKSIGRFLPEARFYDNQEWFCNQPDLDINSPGIIDFLCDVGQHFSVNRMLTQDAVKNRLDRSAPLSFLEFSYMVLQAYDFVKLYERANCTIQMGGSDQWGNIIAGIELGRKMKGLDLYGLTTPLIETAAGEKMGKTATGAVWLNADRLDPYGYWQFWRNTADADVGYFLKLFTELPLDEIARLEALRGAEINEAKKILATEATILCHGRAAAIEAAEAAQAVFEGRAAHSGMPTVEIDNRYKWLGMPVYRLFHHVGLCDSISAARRLLRESGGRINDEVQKESHLFTIADLKDNELILSAGKKRHVRVKFLAP